MPGGRLLAKALEALAARRAARTAARTVAPEVVRPSLAVRPTGPRLLPAPPKTLAITHQPKPVLPPHAVKPKGGQWLADVDFSGTNYSPENAARNIWHREIWEPENLNPEQYPEMTALKDWFHRSAPRYLRNEFGTPDDPIRGIAERGMLGMDPDEWSALADRYIFSDKIGEYMFPRGGENWAGSDLRGRTLAAMPWLAKLPVTDEVYGLGASFGDPLFGDVLSGLERSMTGEIEGLPGDLAVRPEMLNRMSFPQGVERFGRINEWRQAQNEAARLRVANSPALAVHKEYPEGMKWVEYKVPELPEDLGGYRIEPQDFPGGTHYEIKDPEGRGSGITTNEADAREEIRRSLAKGPLEDALGYEGEAMGHCVGGYCENVMDKWSRIFSLRDAKGYPHVTVEAEPGSSQWQRLGSGAIDDETEMADLWNQYAYGPDVSGRRQPGGFEPWLRDLHPEAYAANREMFEVPRDTISQIKGKGNATPVEKYLPYVQDFVKSGDWADVADLHNARMMRLPDERYVTNDQVRNTLLNLPGGEDVPWGPAHRNYWEDTVNDRPAPQRPIPRSFDEVEWQHLAPHFEGFAKGGPVRSLAVTQLTPAQEKRYQRWKVTLPKGLQYEGDYDLRGAFREGAEADYRGHMTDRYKLPNHPTFSVGSMYSTPEDPGGKWTDDVFWASPANLRYQSPSDLIEYLDKAERDHPVTPVLPIHYDLGAR